ncbi:hypothetical protein B0H13DRAFT_2234414 [Mycena leptocephala]|nr:hypothetical protein B0H13DRAFT_2234414 [Mycena leptocephala]
MARILLGCLIGKLPAKGIRACRALLDFIYLAQYSTHDDGTLASMREALDVWHTNRSYFIDTTIREDFNIPKFHSLLHYIECIESFRTTDNYNTEMFEQLHIDFAKTGWRASNRRDECPQMITWLSRQEKVSWFATYLDWLESKQRSPPRRVVQTFTGQAIQLAKTPQLDVYHNFKFEPTSLAPGTRVGRVKVLFRLPDKLGDGTPAPTRWPRTCLAYIEWYSTFKSSHEENHNMYSISVPPRPANGFSHASIIPLTDIRRTCQLFPNFGRTDVDAD